MARTQTIQVVIEVELTEHAQIIPHPLPQVVARRLTLAEQQANEGHEQALLEVLRADATRYAEFVRLLLGETLASYEAKRQLVALAQIPDVTEAVYTLLRELVPRLPAAAQAYFHRAQQQHQFVQSVESVFNAVEVTPLRIRVEYPVLPTERP
jgi:hypothetical protein